MNGWMVLLSGILAGLGAVPATTEMSHAERAAAYATLSPVADRYVLNDDSLPTFDLAEPQPARELIGAYQLKTVVYDSSYQPVAKATQPGRYGAVVEINPGADRKLPPTRRFLTLFRLPERTRLGPQSPDAAMELAARYEVPPGEDPASFYHQSVERDRQWWIGLKRRLYRFDQRFPERFRSPLSIEGKPARVIREGTLAEAGMKPDTARRFDDLLSTWAADSDTAFDVCIVRHGVIVLHKAYGMRHGKPMTTDTMTHLTSTSKMITAAMLMQLVDRGWLSLDGPITDLPGPFHGLPTQNPVTLRAMYTHTAFIGGLNPTRDMEERVAQVLPHLAIGQGYQYTGWGFGTHPQKVDGLSHFTFGHAGYFRSTNFIDPVNDLVVVMLRIGAGTNYDKYHPQFLKLIVDGLIDRVPGFPQALTLTNFVVPPEQDRIEIEAVVQNPGPAAVLEYRYKAAGTAWEFSPPAARIELPPQSHVPVRILARFDPRRPSPLPMLRGQVFAADGLAPPSPPIEYWLRPILRRSVTAGRLKQPPAIDGVFEQEVFGSDRDEQWLLETHGRKDPQYKTRFVTGYDNHALYVAVEAAERTPHAIRRLASQRDDPAIRKEDYIELAVDLVGDGKPPRQFAVNLDGVQYDALGGDVQWNASWTAKVGVGDGQYIVEFAIPYAALGVTSPNPGEKWALNVLRGRGPRDPKWELFSQWVMTYADFNSTTHLGTLHFK